jgi:hypothetical protein
MWRKPGRVMTRSAQADHGRIGVAGGMRIIWCSVVAFMDAEFLKALDDERRGDGILIAILRTGPNTLQLVLVEVQVMEIRNLKCLCTNVIPSCTFSWHAHPLRSDCD